MSEEMDFMIKNKTWVFVPKPQGKSIVDYKWICSVRKWSTDKEPLSSKLD